MDTVTRDGVPIWHEVVTERIGGVVTASVIKPVTARELSAVTARFRRTRRCSHSLVVDTPGYAYDSRDCAVCGKSLGVV